MTNHTRTGQVQQIVANLSSLPGGHEFRVTSRRYPRLGPAEDGSGYEERAWSFNTIEQLDLAALPSDPDEIVVSLRGTMDEIETRSEIFRAISHAMMDLADNDEWDYRLLTRHHAKQGSEYELRVFSAGHPPVH